MDTQPQLAQIKLIDENTIQLNGQTYPILDEWILLTKYDEASKSWKIKSIDLEAISAWLQTN